jgi:hypothetical protein
LGIIEGECLGLIELMLVENTLIGYRRTFRYFGLLARLRAVGSDVIRRIDLWSSFILILIFDITDFLSLIIFSGRFRFLKHLNIIMLIEWRFFWIRFEFDVWNLRSIVRHNGNIDFRFLRWFHFSLWPQIICHAFL